VAQRNLAICRIKNSRVLHADAACVNYLTDNIFAFFYHPFQADVLEVVLERLRTATEGYQLVIAYPGAGRLNVARHTWLESLRELSNLGIFKKKISDTT
jgi:hypothetical protein